MPNFSGLLLDNRFKLLDVLGSGAYGRVYKAVDLRATPQDPQFFAVKCLMRPPAASRRAQFQLREFALHLFVSEHPNIVTFHKVYQDDGFIYVVLDLCAGGDLFTVISPRHSFFGNNERVKSIFLQILDAVHYCHQRRVYHRDLKPENILCSQDFSQVYLADFGLSTQARRSSEFRCGSAYYFRSLIHPPECLGKELVLGSYSTRQNDIWSLGVILTNMITGRNPWRLAESSDPCFLSFLNDRDFLRSVLPISEETNAILKRIFHLNPSGRISIPELQREISAVQSF
ncbi:kinase-like protein, partial [Dendrothele bispora CBS 962.96]